MNNQDLILDHYHHPKNFGKLDAPMYRAETENLSCGDSLAVDIIVKDGIIERVGWTGNGCALSQASISMLSEHITGWNIEDVKKLSSGDVFTLLGTDSFSPARTRCALLSLETVQRAFEKSNQ